MARHTMLAVSCFPFEMAYLIQNGDQSVEVLRFCSIVCDAGTERGLFSFSELNG
jgi:hypothetical protein